MNSLRARLLVGMIGSFALLLAVFGLVLDRVIEFTLVREFDFYLQTLAETLAAAAEADGKHVTVKLVPESLLGLAHVEGELFSQYWTADGAVLARSQNLGGRDLPHSPREAGSTDDRSGVLPFKLWDGRGGRVAQLRFRPNARPVAETSPSLPGTGGSLTVAVARDTTDLESHIRQLRGLLLAAGIGAMGVGAVVSVIVIRRSLQPLSEVAAGIAAIGSDELSTRLSAAALPEEIVPLVCRLNELLQRLEGAFVRERSLTADVAHELRTPLAGILATVGVTLSADRTAAEYQEAFEDVRGIARQMRAMIENLLTLARLDAGQAPAPQETVELHEMVARIWRSCEPLAAARGLVFVNEVPDGLCCLADRTALGVLLSNLLENAVQYADDRGRIWVSVQRANGTASFVVANSGCTLTGDQVARVFDRFWRADAARREASLHVGLGLALVRRIAESWGGTAMATVDGEGTFQVQVAWPSHDRSGVTAGLFHRDGGSGERS